MANNPLQQYFRQPKIYLNLPSNGSYNKPGSIQGDTTNMPVFGMTGMDEILVKTPDALISGESTVKIVESCCPNIKDGWEVSTLDAESIFTAIRIATYGNKLSVSHVCPSCNTENDYDLDLNFIIDFYSGKKYDNKIVISDELTVKTQPINYRQLTDLNIKTFKLQQKLNQAFEIKDEEEQRAVVRELFVELAETQAHLYFQSVESVELQNTIVTDRDHINEWLKNCDKSIIDKIKSHIETTRTNWRVPSFPVKCEECGAENSISIDLDQSNFFDEA